MSAAVPIAPTFGGKPYRVTATLLSAFALPRRLCQLFSRPASLIRRSSHRKMSSRTRPPSGMASIAPSSSGSEYSTTDWRPETPFWNQLAMSCTRSGAATTYGTFFARRRSLAISACRPASIVPAGPPTRGKPMAGADGGARASVAIRRPRAIVRGVAGDVLFTMASTATAPSGGEPCATSCAEVSWSRTMVCASMPLMKMGTGSRPCSSRQRIIRLMYCCRVMTCFRAVPCRGGRVSRPARMRGPGRLRRGRPPPRRARAPSASPSCT